MYPRTYGHCTKIVRARSAPNTTSGPVGYGARVDAPGAAMPQYRFASATQPRTFLLGA